MRGTIAAFLVCVLMLTVCLWAQGAPEAMTGNQRNPPGTPPPPSPAEIEMQKHAARQRNQERFVQLKKDTDHLLELATELKKSVDAANDQTLSLEVIRKAEQIEKLAKQVRQKMMAN
jgi:hypothetical protein